MESINSQEYMQILSKLHSLSSNSFLWNFWDTYNNLALKRLNNTKSSLKVFVNSKRLYYYLIQQGPTLHISLIKEENFSQFTKFDGNRSQFQEFFNKAHLEFHMDPSRYQVKHLR